MRRSHSRDYFSSLLRRQVGDDVHRSVRSFLVGGVWRIVEGLQRFVCCVRCGAAPLKPCNVRCCEQGGTSAEREQQQWTRHADNQGGIWRTSTCIRRQWTVSLRWMPEWPHPCSQSTEPRGGHFHFAVFRADSPGLSHVHDVCSGVRRTIPPAGQLNHKLGLGHPVRIWGGWNLERGDLATTSASSTHSIADQILLFGFRPRVSRFSLGGQRFICCFFGGLRDIKIATPQTSSYCRGGEPPGHPSCQWRRPRPRRSLAAP
mmetsp:Transcript_48324/g.127940  ORF Transcript_48324/g.127940 Transcript_48324/m.127940 type:complete len:260 (-) Transcript_48324:300-1079(-)